MHAPAMKVPLGTAMVLASLLAAAGCGAPQAPPRQPEQPPQPRAETPIVYPEPAAGLLPAADKAPPGSRLEPEGGPPSGLEKAPEGGMATGGLLERRGNDILWNGEDAGRLIGTNLLVYLDGRSLEEKKRDLENIRALGANLVRLNVLPGEWRAFGMDKVEALAEHALSLGMFPIIDYHAIGQPDGYYEEVSWGADEAKPIYDSRFSLAREFWREAARRFEDDGGVIFELWNEPVAKGKDKGPRDHRWSRFAPYWQTLIDDIRAEGARNLILVAGDHWARNLINYDDAPLDDPEDNFGFAYHEYHWGEPQNAGMFIGDLWQRYPILGTEWGLDESHSKPERPKWINYEEKFLDDRFAGWTAWQWATDSAPNLLEKYDPPRLTDYGEYVRDKIGAEKISTRP